MLDYLGYIASLIVLVSLLMSSIKKLRWINLFGALLFGIYGFMINSLPTGLMNLGIVLIDVYYLVKMYRSNDFLRILPINEDKEYLNSFIDFYKEDIEKYQEISDVQLEDMVLKFYILRNMNPAGVFLCSEMEDKVLKVELDYVIPQFRDFKIGSYVFESQKEYIINKGYNTLVVQTDNKTHIGYLNKMGFTKRLNGSSSDFELKLK